MDLLRLPPFRRGPVVEGEQLTEREGDLPPDEDDLSLEPTMASASPKHRLADNDDGNAQAADTWLHDDDIDDF